MNINVSGFYDHLTHDQMHELCSFDGRWYRCCEHLSLTPKQDNCIYDSLKIIFERHYWDEIKMGGILDLYVSSLRGYNQGIVSQNVIKLVYNVLTSLLPTIDLVLVVYPSTDVDFTEYTEVLEQLHIVHAPIHLDNVADDIAQIKTFLTKKISGVSDLDVDEATREYILKYGVNLPA